MRTLLIHILGAFRRPDINIPPDVQQSRRDAAARFPVVEKFYRLATDDERRAIVLALFFCATAREMRYCEPFDGLPATNPCRRDAEDGINRAEADFMGRLATVRESRAYRVKLSERERAELEAAMTVPPPPDVP